MSNEFKREDRYIVFKLSDVERYLTDADRSHLAMMKNEIDAGRDCANKPPFKGLIVESDWPEYEPTWKAIEARVTGAQPAPSEKDEPIRKAWARFSNALHRSPDAPYPGMSEAFEKHFSQSFTDREWRAESGTWAAAWHFKTREEVDAALQSPDFVRWHEYGDGSKCPPSIPWRGLDICYAKPKGRGRYTVYEVVYRDVMTVDVEYALVPGTKE